MKIAGVRFRENWKIYDFDATDVEVAVGDAVIVESDRGQGFAHVVRVREATEMPSEPQPQAAKDQPNRNQNGGRKEDVEVEIEIEVDVPEQPASAAKEAPPTPKGHRMVLRKATEDDLRKAEKSKSREAEAYRACQDMIAERELPMKLIRVEYSFDGSRATFFFFSETRVDFRELVKDLAHKLRSRIEMRQVGVRDVARMIGGYGPCGRELCCTAFLRNFEPVSIRMAKKQDMVLNPAKISGVCGRLLCCLSYEFGMYDEIKKDLATMKEAAFREKKEEEERRIAEQRKEAEERRLADEKRRQEDERRRQEQKREKQRGGEQREGRRPERKKEGQQEQRPRPPQDQPRDRQQQQQQQKPEGQPQQKAEQGQQQGEKQGKKRRGFWRNKKKKKQGGEGPQQGPGGAGGS